jgi:hypothetical protein
MEGASTYVPVFATISTRPIENVVPSEYFERDASRERNSDSTGAGRPA